MRSKRHSIHLEEYTVEPHLMATLVIQSLCYHGHYFLAWQNSQTFSYENPSLMGSPINTANGHILKALMVGSFTISPH